MFATEFSKLAINDLLLTINDFLFHTKGAKDTKSAKIYFLVAAQCSQRNYLTSDLRLTILDFLFHAKSAKDTTGAAFTLYRHSINLIKRPIV